MEINIVVTTVFCSHRQKDILRQLKWLIFCFEVVRKLTFHLLFFNQNIKHLTVSKMILVIVEAHLLTLLVFVTDFASPC